MIVLEFIVVLLSIWFGAYLKGIGIGFAGGLGVLILTLFFGLKPGLIPFDIIGIIMAVITAISTIQVTGGMNYIVGLAAYLLRRHPKYIIFLAPLVTYMMTLLVGTAHTAFSTLPLIAEIAKEQGVRPSRPLSVAVIGSQIAITASPLSAAVVCFSSILEPHGISYLTLIGISLPSTLIAIFCTALFTNFLDKNFKNDYIQSDLPKRNDFLIDEKPLNNIAQRRAKLSVLFFIMTIIIVILYSMAISKNIGFISHPILLRNNAIIVFMLTVAAFICLICKVDTSQVLKTNTFTSGMSACVCIMGVVWLGDTFVGANMNYFQILAGNMMQNHPWILSIVLFFSSALLYSQTATTKAIMPAALMIGVPPLTAVASFAAASALFVLPTYPTLLAAIELDDTGSTKIGKYVFNHSFMIPGILTIFLSVILSFLFCKIIFG